MHTKTFIATTGGGLTRAVGSSDGNWQVDFLLEDQDVRCLAVDPHSPGVVYAGTQGKGVLLSKDGGATWEAGGMDGMVVKSIAPSPLEPGRLYAGTRPASLFVSQDGGENWQEIESFKHIRSRRWWFSPAEPPFSAYIQGIALSPSNPQVIVAGIEAGAVVRSDDGGETWSDHRQGAVRDCHSITFHATDGNWVYEAGGTGAGAAISQDSGATWQQPREGLDKHYGWACAADPAQPEIWYVSASSSFSFPQFAPAAHIDGQANAYIYRSTNRGAWQRLNGGLPQPLDYMAYTLLTDPEAPGHIYAGLSNGQVWFSQDHGDRWQKLPFELKGIHRTLIMF